MQGPSAYEGEDNSTQFSMQEGIDQGEALTPE